MSERHLDPSDDARYVALAIDQAREELQTAITGTLEREKARNDERRHLIHIIQVLLSSSNYREDYAREITIEAIRLVEEAELH